MVHNFTRTVALDISGFPASTARNLIASAIANRFLSLKVTALQFVGNIAQVSFADTASKELIMRMEPVYVGDIACPVRGGGAVRATKKYLSTIIRWRQVSTRCLSY